MQITIGRIGFKVRHPRRVVTDAAPQAIAGKLTRDVFSGQVSARATRAASLQFVGSQVFDVRAQPLDAGNVRRGGLLGERNAERQQNDQYQIEKLAMHEKPFGMIQIAPQSYTALQDC